MKITEARLNGVKEFEIQSFSDHRGTFFEWFRNDLFSLATGAEFALAQANCSISNKGVLRGIHFAAPPDGQAKFVTCLAGRIHDVAVDLRPNSPTFGEWEMFELSKTSQKAIYIPNGFGHAFMALDDDTIVAYLCDRNYNPTKEFEISPLDPDIGIKWDSSIQKSLSDKDLAAPSFKEIKSKLEDFYC